MIAKLKNQIFRFLHWSEKYTKTDMVYVAKGGTWLTGSKIISSGTAFILAIAYANLLPKETYGQYKYILSLAGLLGIASLSGIDLSLARSVVKGFEGSLTEAIKIKLKWGILGMLAGFGLSGYYFLKGNNELGFAMLFAAIFTPLINAIIYGPFLESKKLFRVMSEFSIINQVAVAGLMISGLMLSPSIILLIFIYYSVNLAVQTLLLYWTFKKYKTNDKKDPQTLSFGMHLSAMNVLGLIADQLDKILMWHFLGPAQLAVYSFATIPVTQIQSFLKSILVLAFPKIASQDAEITKKTLPAKVFKFIGALVFVILIYLIISPYFYKIFFKEYVDSIKYSYLYSLSLIFFPVRILSYPLIAQIKQKNLYILNIAGPAFKIAFLLILLPWFGIWGAIAALLISSLLGSLVTYYYFRKL